MDIQEKFEEAKNKAESLFTEIADYSTFNRETFNDIMEIVLNISIKEPGEKERLVISNWLWWMNYRILSSLFADMNEKDSFELKGIDMKEKGTLREILVHSAFLFSAGNPLSAECMYLFR